MSHRLRTLLVTLLASVVSVCWLVVVSPPATAVETGKVRGNILAKGADTPKVDVRWFTRDWTYLGEARALGGGYLLTLPVGDYYLQVVDRAPTYDVKRFAPTDVAVSVTAGATTVADVRMRRGGAIGGTVTTGGKPARGARVVAANTSEQSFETTTDKTGSYALGGLPPGKYSVFTYDRTRKWVGRSTYVGTVKKGFESVSPRLTKKAGSLIVDLYAGGAPVTEVVYLTAVSESTGQFWTVKSSGGTATFRGLHPGRYRIVAPALQQHAALTAPVAGGSVRPGRAAFGSFTWL